MKRHIKVLSQERAALAADSSVIALKQFTSAILTAVNGLLGRKAAANNS